jgi:hypothetical protein
LTTLARYAFAFLLIIVVFSLFVANTNNTLATLKTQSQTSILTDMTPAISITAPGDAAFGTIPFATSAKQQIVAATTGSVDVSQLEASQYTLKVKGNSTKLTKGSDTFTNDLFIATGLAGDSTVGDVDAAVALTPGYGNYSGTDEAEFIAVTTSDSAAIGGNRTIGGDLKLVVYQKINASEAPPAGNYILTLTYTVAIVP